MSTALDYAPVLLPHPGRTTPLSLEEYRAEDGYAGWRKALTTMTPDEVVEQVKAAGLRGRGGAGFPTGAKWGFIPKAPGAKYVAVNADESEPGTFKDRELIEVEPHRVLEGVALCCYAIGAETAIIYIRGEYVEAANRLEAAIAEAEAANILGRGCLGTQVNVRILVFRGAGAYICGEETALLESLEGRRPMPRSRPPFPAVEGLYRRPTVINNVETLCWTPGIVLKGGEWYRDQGINGEPGLRFVSISGDVAKPGVYEVPFGQTVRDLVFNTAGGMREGQKLKAVATSGPSGGFLPAQIKRELLPEKFVAAKMKPDAKTYDILDLPLGLNTVASMGGMLGAAFVVYGDKADMVENALNCVEFYRNESCGKCVPCRMGSEKMTELIKEMLEGRFRREQLPLINDLADTMTLASICGLGQVAANPITSVIKYFREELDAYLSK